MKRHRTPDLEDNRPSAPSEWTTPSRARVKQLKKVGFSALDIYKETGVPRTTQYRWLEDNAPVRRPGAECSGRPIKLDQDTVKKMVKHMEGHYDRRTWTWIDCVTEFQLDCCPATVRNHFNQAGYYKCRCCQKSWINQNQADTRKNTCEEWKEWKEWQWKPVCSSIFTVLQTEDFNQILRYIGPMRFTFIKILDIRSGLYEIVKKGTVRIAYRNVDVLQELNSVYGL